MGRVSCPRNGCGDAVPIVPRPDKAVSPVRFDPLRRMKGCWIRNDLNNRFGGFGQPEKQPVSGIEGVERGILQRLLRIRMGLFVEAARDDGNRRRDLT